MNIKPPVGINPPLIENEKIVTFIPDYNLDKLHQMSRGKPEFVHRMVRLFMEELPKTFFELKMSLEEKDFDSVKEILKNLTPSVKMIDCHDLLAHIEAVEVDIALENELEEIPNRVLIIIEECQLVRNKIRTDIWGQTA